MASAADPMLQDEYDKYVIEMQEMGQEPMPLEQFRQQAVAGMATGGVAKPTYTQSRKQRIEAAGGGIMGSNAGSMLVAPTADGSRPGYGWLSDINEKRKKAQKKIVEDIIPNELKSVATNIGEGARKIIPNELAEVAAKTAPLVAPFQPGVAAAMRGLGRYDERGDLGDALKQAALTYGAGKVGSKVIDAGKGIIDQATIDALKPLNLAPSGEPDSIEEWLTTSKDPNWEYASPGTIGSPSMISIGKEKAKDSILSNIGGSLGSGIGALIGGAGDILGGAGEIARKGLATILPGGDPGYVPGGLYKTAGQAIMSPVSAAEKTIREMTTGTDSSGKKIEDAGKKKSYDNWFEGLLQTVLPGGEPGFVPGGMYNRLLGLTDPDGKPIDFSEKGAYNIMGPLTIGTAMGAAQAAMPKAKLPADTSAIDMAAAKRGDDLRFRPPEEALLANGGRIGYALGNKVEQDVVTAFSNYKNQGGLKGFKDWFSGIYLPEMPSMTRQEDDKDPWAKGAPYGYSPAGQRGSIDIEYLGNMAQGGRVPAQEGGLMDLGGMEKDYRQEGGFVPIGGQERADDVPARLSKNEFVFTADAVRSAGGGDIDKGAEVMENVMENLERGGQISEESQGLEGARNMFATAQRLEGVL